MGSLTELPKEAIEKGSRNNSKSTLIKREQSRDESADLSHNSNHAGKEEPDKIEKTPESCPILNNPYDEPAEYWELDVGGRATGRLVEGRRPSAPYPTVPAAGSHPREPTSAEMDMHRRINLIRKGVDSWRDAGYPGIPHEIARLLRYWRGDDQSGTRAFYCQASAIETLVWLCDAPESVNPSLPKLRSEIGLASAQHNGDILRYATKMATGTGKTMVMGMIIAWCAMREPGRTDILVLVPNLTIKERLKVLIPDHVSGEGKRDDVYGDILPRNTRLPEDTKVSIMNYQAFQTRSQMGLEPGEQVDPTTRNLITAGGAEPDHWKESPSAMLDRLLLSHRGAKAITVLNDEAHHCYRPDDPDAKADKEEAVSPKEAAIWFSCLSALRDEGRLGMVFDMSATPMFISNAGKKDTELFPWVVSDYPLIDAIEAGLVKIPRVPVKELSGFDEPKFRNIYRFMKKADRKLRHDSMHADIRDLLERLQLKYREESERYAKKGKIPVMIVVAYPIENAKALYKHLAGYKAGDTWIEGYEMFSNVREGKPLSSPSTLLVTSDLDNMDDKAWADLAIEQETFFPKHITGKKERIDHIREVFSTVGSPGEPGENIRCVVSVNMLTEGWDARTVTHIFGYRPFKSDLLCEQVAGRALRRSSIPALASGEVMVPEYAGIFGIPFSFIMGTGKSGPEKETWPLRTEPGREQFRMRFPNIMGYEISEDPATFKLDSARVKPFPMQKLSDKSGDVLAKGMVGAPQEYLDSMRAHTAIFRLAQKITNRYGSRGKGRASLFQSALGAVHEWLGHENVKCPDERLLAYHPNDENAARAIWEACTEEERSLPIRPVFQDEGNPGAEHELDTTGVSTVTSSLNRYPQLGGITAKSEINIAACDSADEVEVARILDTHDGVEAWVRNHKLGWSIPYIEPKIGSYREYYPDFVARLRGGKTHLVIEFKGQETRDALAKKAETEDKWIPAVNASDDPACAGRWLYVYIDNQARIGTELDEAIREGLK